MLSTKDIHEDAPALYYYNESYVFALTIIPKMDRSDMDITSKLQLETRCVLHVESYGFNLTLIQKNEKIFLAVIPKIQCCGPGSWIRCLFDPGIRDVKKSGSGSGMNNPDHISESLETIFCVKILNFLMRIWYPEWKKFGPGIRDRKYSDPKFGINIPDPQHCQERSI